ncbi:putative NBD/HSP70 family sugar kinase [Thermocatellispora tengchongensis]|uniref:Putative NBD/HSP70 family sugar kinase n=1 Tax=Thermocatellispora tengchongensis TaxID=1073253 RepID=A0A840P5D1_9ACTN|nr:ROK family transcriptional regulator [Thermocatellispora tengchongensis]MBB5132680.1 putative NBD/HSP70 family sugar kinase [Thermocatellispora tengchongensis]
MTFSSGEERTVPGSPGDVLTLISAGSATTRSDLARVTGLARSTISQRVDALIERGLVRETESGESTGGRPPRQLRLHTADHVVAGVDLGATHCRIKLMDISGAVLTTCEDPMLIAEGPETVLTHVDARIARLLTEAGRDRGALKAIGMGVPGPVEFATGRPNNPPIMPGWNDYPVPEFFAGRYDATVLVDNDVNVMALGEQRDAFENSGYLLFVKVGTGIGCGIVTEGRLHRGAQGSAGDIGHIRVSGHDEAGCRCGNSACLEAVAGGAALARRLTDLGFPAESAGDVVALVQSGNTQALRLVREAGRLIGEVLASLVNFYNPEVIVIGGALARVHDHLLAGIRETIYRRSLPLATHHLTIVPSHTGEDAAALGAGILAIEHYLAPDNINRIVNAGESAGVSA